MTAIHVGMPGIQGHQSGTQVSFILLVFHAVLRASQHRVVLEYRKTIINLTSRETQHLSGPEGEGYQTLPRSLGWALRTSTRDSWTTSRERKPTKLCPGKGACQPSIWAPVPAWLWSWYCAVLAGEQRQLVLPPSWTPAPPALVLLLL